MERIETSLSGVNLITPSCFSDDRGFFSGTFNRQPFAEIGVATENVRDNHVHSADARTLRGVHFQAKPIFLTKLIEVLRGAILDGCIDLRDGSLSFGKRIMAELTVESRQQVVCPKRLTRGTLALMPHTEIAYRVDANYASGLDMGVGYDDPDFAFVWPFFDDERIFKGKSHRQLTLAIFPEIFAEAEINTKPMRSS